MQYDSIISRMLFRPAAASRALTGSEHVAISAESKVSVDPSRKSHRSSPLLCTSFRRVHLIAPTWSTCARAVANRHRVFNAVVLAVLVVAIFWGVNGGVNAIIDYIGSHLSASCPQYGPYATGITYSVMHTDSEGCVSYCSVDNVTSCSSTFCGLHIVRYGGRAGNAFIHMAVGRLLARRRRAAFITPPVIDGFGALPASFQSSCPVPSYSAWPLLWRAPWALEVRARVVCVCVCAPPMGPLPPSSQPRPHCPWLRRRLSGTAAALRAGGRRTRWQRWCAPRPPTA